MMFVLGSTRTGKGASSTSLIVCVLALSLFFGCVVCISIWSLPFQPSLGRCLGWRHVFVHYLGRIQTWYSMQLVVICCFNFCLNQSTTLSILYIHTDKHTKTAEELNPDYYNWLIKRPMLTTSAPSSKEWTITEATSINHAASLRDGSNSRKFSAVTIHIK